MPQQPTTGPDRPTGEQPVPFRSTPALKTAWRASHRIKAFLASEDGAITVDWVVLTAAIVGLGIAVLIPIGFSTESSVAALQGDILAVDTGYTTTAP
jgi:hypothetical protein